MTSVPERIFVVPYRHRVQQRFFFCKYMHFLLENMPNYEIIFAHQHDDRTFNRGAMKNLGFLAAKAKYPDHYQDITFIFNDVDTLPFHKIFDYQTTHGVVKHYYGYTFALGGIVVMKGADFERINGFPCFWGWGSEDNVLQLRCDYHGLRIDRSQFYKIGSPEILQLFDGITRIIARRDPWRGTYDDRIDGLSTLTHIDYSLDEASSDPGDHLFNFHDPRIWFANIRAFSPRIPYGSELYYQYDLREPPRKIIHPDKIRETQRTAILPHEWTHIPHMPTAIGQKQQLLQQLRATGQPVPPALVAEIEHFQESNHNHNQQPTTLSPSFLPQRRRHRHPWVRFT